MPEVDGVQLAPADEVVYWRKRHRDASELSWSWQRRAEQAEAKLRRLERLLKELESSAPAAVTVLIRGALER